MQANFLDAHHRHWNDAERLFLAQRWANADHLYGVAVECGLKRLMLAFGMLYDTAKDRPTDRSDQKHANIIWERFESYRGGHPLGTGFALPTVANPFVDWDVSDRYAHQSNFDEVRTKSHQIGAQAVCELIKKAQLEGLI